jgi:hypothetical protein
VVLADQLAYGTKRSCGLWHDDVSGAASYFKTYYVVGSKSWGAFDMSLGQAKVKVMPDYALLKGSFGAHSWRAIDWSKLSVQRIWPNTWANASLQAPVFNTGMNVLTLYSSTAGMFKLPIVSP